MTPSLPNHLARTSLLLIALILVLAACHKPRPLLYHFKVEFLKQPAELPLEVLDGHIFVNAQIKNSEPMRFVIDSGASFDVLRSDIIERFALREVAGSRFQIVSFSGSQKLKLFNGTPFHLGDAIYSPSMLVRGTFLDRIAAHHGHSVEGLIGHRFFAASTLELDYDSQIIRLHLPEKFEAQNGSESIAVDISLNIPIISAAIEKPDGTHVSGRFVIDTGANGALILSELFAQKCELLQDHSADEPSSYNVDASHDAHRGRLHHFHLGSHTFEHVPFEVPETKIDDQNKFDGWIGNDLLKRFTIVFDYSHKRLLLKRNKNFSTAFAMDTSGLGLAATGEYFDAIRIELVRPNSPAFDSGIKKDDLLLSIDGDPVSGHSLVKIRQLFRHPSCTYTLQIKRGGQTSQVLLTTKRFDH